MDADFSLKLSTAKSNSFSVLADFFSKGIFKDAVSSERGNPEQQPPLHKKSSVEKLRIQANLQIVPGQFLIFS
jgi:hypothetical protein